MTEGPDQEDIRMWVREWLDTTHDSFRGMYPTATKYVERKIERAFPSCV